MAGATLSRAERRATVAAQNIANLTTPGYRAHRQFEQLITIDESQPYGVGDSQDSIDARPGKLIATHNPLDLAIAGNGYFMVRSGRDIMLTRNGQFTRDADGNLVAPDGAVLQSTSGDLALVGGPLMVDPDGTMRTNDAKAKLAVVDASDPSQLEPAGSGRFAMPSDGAMHQVDSPVIRQGMLEASNVSDAEEMLSTMSALRSAESGQRLVQLYDDLMAKALTGFGQGLT